MTITLYDISSTIPGAAWSPNVYKTRMALNYKGLEYKTEWVEYPDIGPLAKKIGALPTSIGATRELYTVPIIHDHATGKVASDSFAIAQYLDETYPDQPKLFPAGPGIAAIFDSYWMQHPIPALSKIVQPTIFRRLNTASHEFFRNSRERVFGCQLEELAPPGPDREDGWSKIYEGLNLFSKLLGKNGKNEPFVLGEKFSYADIIMASWLFAVKRVVDEDEWKPIASLDEGRWEELLGMTEKYQTIH